MYWPNVGAFSPSDDLTYGSYNILAEVILGGDPNIGRTEMCVLLYYVSCATLVHALVYCNFSKEVRLGN